MDPFVVGQIDMGGLRSVDICEKEIGYFSSMRFEHFRKRFDRLKLRCKLLSHRAEIWINKRNIECLILARNENLLDEPRLDGIFDPRRNDILSVVNFIYFLASTGDSKHSSLRQATKIACSQAPLALIHEYRLASRFFIVPVAHHYIRANYTNFAFFVWTNDSIFSRRL